MPEQISVRVTPRSSQESVHYRTDFLYYEVKTRAVPDHGEANKRVCELLAQYFSLPVSLVEIKKGHRSRNKIILLHTL